MHSASYLGPFSDRLLTKRIRVLHMRAPRLLLLAYYDAGVLALFADPCGCIESLAAFKPPVAGGTCS